MIWGGGWSKNVSLSLCNLNVSSLMFPRIQAQTVFHDAVLSKKLCLTDSGCEVFLAVNGYA